MAAAQAADTDPQEQQRAERVADEDLHINPQNVPAEDWQKRWPKGFWDSVNKTDMLNGLRLERYYFANSWLPGPLRRGFRSIEAMIQQDQVITMYRIVGMQPDDRPLHQHPDPRPVLPRAWNNSAERPFVEIAYSNSLEGIYRLWDALILCQNQPAVTGAQYWRDLNGRTVWNPADILNRRLHHLCCRDANDPRFGLTCLREKHDAGAVWEDGVDIVCLHGFFSSVRKNFTTKPVVQGRTLEPTLWIQEWLPQDVDCASLRVFAVDYQTVGAAVHLENRAAWLLRILRRARLFRRSVIFVAHSYGGLVIKEMCCRLRDEEKNRVRGVCFLATPHLGSPVSRIVLDPVDLASYFLGLFNVVDIESWEESSLGRLVGLATIQDLRHGANAMLTNLNELFDATGIRSMYLRETRPTPLKKLIPVMLSPEQSAHPQGSVDREGNTYFPGRDEDWNVNNAEICTGKNHYMKPVSREDEVYRKVRDFIKDFARPSTLGGPPTPPQSPRQPTSGGGGGGGDSSAGGGGGVGPPAPPQPPRPPTGVASSQASSSHGGAEQQGYSHGKVQQGDSLAVGSMLGSGAPSGFDSHAASSSIEKCEDDIETLRKLHSTGSSGGLRTFNTFFADILTKSASPDMRKLGEYWASDPTATEIPASLGHAFKAATRVARRTSAPSHRGHILEELDAEGTDAERKQQLCEQLRQLEDVLRRPQAKGLYFSELSKMGLEHDQIFASSDGSVNCQVVLDLIRKDAEVFASKNMDYAPKHWRYFKQLEDLVEAAEESADSKRQPSDTAWCDKPNIEELYRKHKPPALQVWDDASDPDLAQILTASDYSSGEEEESHALEVTDRGAGAVARAVAIGGAAAIPFVAGAGVVAGVGVMAGAGAVAGVGVATLIAARDAQT